MDVSIILCTRNRADDLRQTLEAFRGVHIPSGWDVELIVVDNGSTDGTAELVTSFAIHALPIRYVFEARAGQCFARNTGIATARGRCLLFTDDDVRPPVDWIGGLGGVLLGGTARAVVGSVRLSPDLARDWQKPIHLAMLADTRWDESEGKSNLVGANMGIHRRVLEDVPAFDQDLDPGALGLGGDTLFGLQCHEAGHPVTRVHEVCMIHCPDPSRLLRKSLLRAGENVGRFHGWRDYHWEHNTPRFPALRQLRWQGALRVWRTRNPAEVVREEGIAEAELYYLMWMYRFVQFRQEQGKPRKYDRHGLFPRDGNLAIGKTQ